MALPLPDHQLHAVVVVVVAPTKAELLVQAVLAVAVLAKQMAWGLLAVAVSIPEVAAVVLVWLQALFPSKHQVQVALV